MSASVGAGAAYADHPPTVVPGLMPPGPPMGPPDDTEQNANTACASTQSGGDGPAVPDNQASLNLPAAWRFSQGEGQLVAVIDTGVAPNPRLPGLSGGGDYVSHSDGLSDCDGHGTAVAGLIAASRVPGQGFAGVAPLSRIVSIRQTSNFFSTKGSSQGKKPEDMPGYGTTYTLAWAIRRAADLGARVINISEAACKPSYEDMPDGPIGSALQYAVDEHDAVVVVAAGNKDHDCKDVANKTIDPLDPAADPWTKIDYNFSPARYDDYVLAVGSVDANGQPSKFSVPGPWVGVAAPGEHVTSLDVNYEQPGSKGTITGMGDTPSGKAGDPIMGTSFAAPYVAGVAALVRAKFPDLPARDVIKRIEATAHAPAEGWNPYIGYGTVDPVAALTAEVPDKLPPKHPLPARSLQLPVPANPPAPDNTARNVALIGTGAVALLLVLGYLGSFPIRRFLDSKN
ncbi:type VII secretion-associated serine protease mycosin [Nocardia stercoris]|uniref:type VII secretion-associated serine protease mycosin n=1 Tax=Nocardia stercoris TaxID=2483361 RepID=UPI001F25708D|nr:type VII secretion-associated serine protease mycosin [Nocardia stercoris]